MTRADGVALLAITTFVVAVAYLRHKLFQLRSSAFLENEDVSSVPKEAK
jgi:hypothetical protein